MVSDRMSSGMLNIDELQLQRKEGRGSMWIDLYCQNRVALMETASANLSVSDSVAGSSSWGGGKRVDTGKLNVWPDGTLNKPILQKFKEAGISVGCVTTVPITHATPAGFCVNMKSRSLQDRIASEYLKLKFEVMMGGGLEYFKGEKREHKMNIFGQFESTGFKIVKDKTEMANTNSGKPVVTVFQNDGLPYALDLQNTEELKSKIPTLAEMTKSPNGFVMQVEGGKVDWVAHANDTEGLLYDQIDFD